MRKSGARARGRFLSISIFLVFSQAMKSLGGTTENQKTLERYWQRWEIEFSGQNLDAEIVRVGPGRGPRAPAQGRSSTDGPSPSSPQRLCSFAKGGERRRGEGKGKEGGNGGKGGGINETKWWGSSSEAYFLTFLTFLNF